MNETFMLRALELATLGRGHVSPNPMVGCVIVYGERIIGEGWHQRYGEAHAERNAIFSVRPEDEHLLPESTAYVTLEPCSHYGKQPPCADLLIQKRIGRVVCCNDDPNPLVSGQGFDKLRTAGIIVETGVLAPQGRELNARFFTFFEGEADRKKRPYIILKWAETTDGFIGAVGGKPVKISGDLSHRLVHRWRSEEDAIMVGTNTARNDNPSLSTRLWPGKNPVRIVIDNQLSLDPNLNLFDGTQPTIVYHQVDENNVADRPNVFHSFASRSTGPFLNQLLADLHQRNIQSVLVEGGTTLLQSFMDAGLWDEMRVFRSRMMLGEGRFADAIKAPVVRGKLASREMVGEDELTIYKNSPGS
jgi:diaminohydroxyphosphoribosylaminopyrimidine deaminase/5-amino-6-(5-phosphoribosylamino)uracil reductase